MAIRQSRARDRILSLQERAEDGDWKAWEELKGIEGEYSGYADYLVKNSGDIGAIAEDALIKGVVGRDLIALEALHKSSGELRGQLGGEDPSPLECLLIQRIVCCWIQANYATAYHAENQDRFTFKQESYQQMRQDRAHQRFLRAIKVLAQVRRLLGPNIQVNVAEKQINVQSTSET